MQSQRQLKRAIVIGGSIAGLLSAKVLSAAFDEVLIVERDLIPKNTADRTGVPQSPQPHILLTQGYRLLKDFFPGLEKDLQAAGAVPVDWGQDFQYFAFGDWCANTTEPTGLDSVSCTRPLLETAVRRQVEQIVNVKRLSPYRVEGVIGSADKVTGVRCRQSKDKTDERMISADLIVDASGRSTNALKWLAALGASIPDVEKIDAQLGYATGRYRIPDDWNEDWKVLLISHEPPKKTQLGYLARVENNELIATLGGYCQEYPPLVQDEFMKAAKQLPDGAFYEAIAQSTPISKIKAYRSTANRLYHYEQLDKMPMGFVAIGDAVCALCPAYGQGLTTSAMSALTLQDWLLENAKNDEVGESLAFQKKIAKRIQSAWSAATTNDSGFLNGEGDRKKNFVGRLLSGYMRRLVAKTHTDGELTLALAKITHMVDSPAKLLHPKMIFKVLT
ncbi:MAG: monooxygenase [Leptolyngbya foveolarum]|uniref:Monooxygenase n=1 Tax=Leptolyngbya foveolarum TaxID=47253 RepID=A0A2W4TMV2_9CYAN|nr:MAG: monooxygenase [Leptolyngbya foveolarum]